MRGIQIIIGVFFVILPFLSSWNGGYKFLSKYYKRKKSGSRYDMKNQALINSELDLFKNFTQTEKFFFQRFAKAVANEINEGEHIPRDYTSLIDMINHLTFSSVSKSSVNDRSKRMLVNLFPPGLLPAYKALFSPFPVFSGIMNAWVTHWTTSWLMGPSKVEDYCDEKGSIRKDQRVHIEKCRFLEQSGCIQVCLHACKVPTQRFFLEEMGLPVTLTPNFTDYSCQFDFNKFPISIAEDSSLNHPCLLHCPSQLTP